MESMDGLRSSACGMAFQGKGRTIRAVDFLTPTSQLFTVLPNSLIQLAGRNAGLPDREGQARRDLAYAPTARLGMDRRRCAGALESPAPIK
jgi:hypothetical protein